MVNILLYLSYVIIPAMIFFILLNGFISGCKVYDRFVEGAKNGLTTVVSILPTLIGLMVATGILRASGFLDFLSKILSPLTSLIGFPSQALPTALIKLFSSSAATGLALDVFKRFGTDSFIGMTVSLMLSCTETVFYTMSVYFIAAKVTKTRWTLQGAFLSTLVGIIVSVILAGILT